MRAAIAEDARVEIRDVPTPDPAPEEALVRVTSSGVCHSDIHIVKGDWSRATQPGPLPLGHEGIGVVEAIGSGADRHLAVGDRVIFGLGGAGGGYWCGACRLCMSGLPMLCPQGRPAFGSHAEYFHAWAGAFVKLPDSIGNDEVSLACAGLTAYAALKKLAQAGVPPGAPVAIVGAAGGLGHYAVQMAAALGYAVVGVDVGADRVEFIRNLGATAAYDVSEAADRVHADFGGARASLVLTARIAGYELGFRLLGRAGVVVCVGIPPASDGSLGVRPLDLIFRGTRVIPSLVGTVQEMREVVDFAARGRVHTHVGRKGALEELPQILDELERGAYAGRAVLAI